jgi:hypothetical protein
LPPEPTEALPWTSPNSSSTARSSRPCCRS